MLKYYKVASITVKDGSKTSKITTPPLSLVELNTKTGRLRIYSRINGTVFKMGSEYITLTPSQLRAFLERNKPITPNILPNGRQ